MSELTVHSWLVYALLATGLPVFLVLFFLNAGYGRHLDESSWLPTVPARVAWLVMESPAVFGFAAVYLAGTHRWEWIPLVLAGMFLFHYVNRGIIYPLRMRPGASGVGLHVVVLAFLFQSVNAYVIARWISELGDYSAWSMADPRLLLGLGLFAVGWWINTDSDRILRRLRKPGETGYKIPHGGLYRWVSAPNYLGEILEWVGFAVASWSLAGLAFAVFTVANLAPRAWKNHQWYLERFEDYPPERKALIPFLV